MHEMALVRSLVEVVLDYAKKENATAVREIYLSIGESRDVVEEYMDGLFKFLARGTVAEHADLIMVRIPYTVRCNQCGQIFRLNVFDESTWVCPACKAEKDYTLNTGTEFRIEGIVIDHAETPQAGTGENAGGDEV